MKARLLLLAVCTLTGCEENAPPPRQEPPPDRSVAATLFTPGIDGSEPVSGFCQPLDPGNAAVRLASELPRGMPPRRVFHTDDDGLEAAVRCVVGGEAEWRALGTLPQSQPLPDLSTVRPPVDFEREVLIVVAWGRRGSTGYDIHVTHLDLRGDTLVAFVRRSETGPHVEQMMTNPMDVVRAPRTAGPIYFAVQ